MSQDLYDTLLFACAGGDDWDAALRARGGPPQSPRDQGADLREGHCQGAAAPAAPPPLAPALHVDPSQLHETPLERRDTSAEPTSAPCSRQAVVSGAAPGRQDPGAGLGGLHVPADAHDWGYRDGAPEADRPGNGAAPLRGPGGGAAGAGALAGAGGGERLHSGRREPAGAAWGSSLPDRAHAEAMLQRGKQMVAAMRARGHPGSEVRRPVFAGSASFVLVFGYMGSWLRPSTSRWITGFCAAWQQWQHLVLCFCCFGQKPDVLMMSTVSQQTCCGSGTL